MEYCGVAVSLNHTSLFRMSNVLYTWSYTWVCVVHMGLFRLQHLIFHFSFLDPVLRLHSDLTIFVCSIRYEYIYIYLQQHLLLYLI